MTKLFEILCYRNSSKYNEVYQLRNDLSDFRTQVERKQTDETEPIQTSRVVTDEVSN